MQKKDKREAILLAALELIAQNGLQHTPMSQIATHAGVSAGIIYHYFASKEELIQALYRRVKSDIARAVLVIDPQQLSLPEQFSLLWTRMFRYCVAHPQEIVFLEQYESSPAWQPREEAVFEEEAAFYQLLQEYRTQGLLKNLPTAAFQELTMGVATRLARDSAAGLLTVDDEVLASIAKACWDAIAK